MSDINLAALSHMPISKKKIYSQKQYRKAKYEMTFALLSV